MYIWLLYTEHVKRLCNVSIILDNILKYYLISIILYLGIDKPIPIILNLGIDKPIPDKDMILLKIRVLCQETPWLTLLLVKL